MNIKHFNLKAELKGDDYQSFLDDILGDNEDLAKDRLERVDLLKVFKTKSLSGWVKEDFFKLLLNLYESNKLDRFYQFLNKKSFDAAFNDKNLMKSIIILFNDMPVLQKIPRERLKPEIINIIDDL